jgi:hypothetical protein
MMVALLAGLFLGQVAEDWREGFIVPTPKGARVVAECPSLAEGDLRASCLQFAADSARSVRIEIESWLISQGFSVVEVPEFDRGFMRVTDDERCEGGYLTTFIVEGEPDPEKAGLLVISLLEDTCGQPAAEEKSE